MKIQTLAKFGLVALVLGGVAGPALADPYLGEWRYGDDWDARHAKHRAFHERREAARDAMEGDFGAARFHERQAHRAQRRANWDRVEDGYYGY